MEDAFVSALCQDTDIILGMAQTTQACRQAQVAHGLQGKAAVAMGRLLTGLALLRFCTPRVGTMSLQVLSDGTLNQLFADINAEGHLRGYCKGTAQGAAAGVRVSIRADVGQGMISVLRAQTQEEFTRSTTTLSSGEIDEDLATYASASDQVPTWLTCDVLLDATGQVAYAGGLIAQELPNAQPGALHTLGAAADLPTWLTGGLTPTQMLATWNKSARVLHTQPLGWQCRCSQSRAEAAVRMLTPVQLATMINDAETAEIDCEFCGTKYRVPPSTLAQILSELPSEGLH